MSNNKAIRLGTRGSKLALWQAYYVQEQLQKKGANSEIVIIETKGDKILDRSLSKIGSKGVFTEELEEQLRSGEIDVAVHSAKDMQSELPEDLTIIAFTEREQVNDVLVSHHKNLRLDSGESFVIGTSSTRRVAMLKAFYPHLKIVDMRGNLQTRIKKMEDGACDALLLAFAGVNRMGYNDMIVDTFPIEQFTPAVGQGSVAIEASKNLDNQTVEIIRDACNHLLTEPQLLAERAYLRKLQGGCSIPIFGNCSLADDKQTLILNAGIISLDGKKILRKTLEYSLDKATELGELMADEILAMGGDIILKEIKEQL